MITIISAARRNPSLSFEAFKRVMQVEHAPLVARFPRLEGYRVRFAVDATKSPWDVVVELRFSDHGAFELALASAEGQRALEHMRKVVDVSTIQSGVFVELADASAPDAR
jgi:hypothetical protein